MDAKNVWSEDDLAQLIAYVVEYGRHWTVIADQLGGRHTARQCRSKWEIERGTHHIWTRAEDEALLVFHAGYAMRTRTPWRFFRKDIKPEDAKNRYKTLAKDERRIWADGVTGDWFDIFLWPS
jgi:hypothetical protein